MGKCIYCGQKAGFFKSKHDECERRHLDGIAHLKDVVTQCFIDRKDFMPYKEDIDRTCEDAFLSVDDRDAICCEIFDREIEHYLEEGVIGPKEEMVIGRFMTFTELPDHVVDGNGSLRKVVQSKVIREILNGEEMTPNFNVPKNLPFTLDEGEQIIWIFGGVKYFLEKGERDYEEIPQEFLIPTGKGTYISTKAFKDFPMETSYMEHIGTGPVCLTNKNLYFNSHDTALKIPLTQIAAIDPYPNGLGIRLKDTGERSLFFTGLNSWLTHNVIANLK